MAESRRGGWLIRSEFLQPNLATGVPSPGPTWKRERSKYTDCPLTFPHRLCDTKRAHTVNEYSVI